MFLERSGVRCLSVLSRVAAGKNILKFFKTILKNKKVFQNGFLRQFVDGGIIRESGN
jgi:hypothetical protein